MITLAVAIVSAAFGVIVGVVGFFLVVNHFYEGPRF